MKPKLNERIDCIYYTSLGGTCGCMSIFQQMCINVESCNFFEVKDKKKIAKDRDKKSVVESTRANDSKPVIGSVPSDGSGDFLSVKEQANPDRLNSEGAQKEKICPNCEYPFPHLFTNDIYECDECGYRW